jgi:hypothetical protein
MPISAEAVLSSLGEAFDSEEELIGFISMSKPALQRSKIEAELKALQDDQAATKQNFEDQIQAKQAEFDEVIQQMRFKQVADFEAKKGPIADKQAELDALVALIQKNVGGS